MIKINDLKLNIGTHIKWEKTLYNTLLSAINQGMQAFQFFLGNPKSFDRCQVTQEDITQTKKLNTNFACGIFSHAPYLYNLCGSKAQLAWEGDDTQDKKTSHVLKQLEYELGVLANFKNNGVIVHPGNYTDREKGLCKISETINKINFVDNSNLLLENSAGQGTTLATTIEELASIYNNIEKNKQKYIGFCLDTAHLCGYGEFDVSKIDEIARLFKKFDELIGLDKLKLIHLNDSCVPLGSKKDRHAMLGTGFIWTDNQNSLVYLINLCKKLKIHVVLETCPEDMNTVFMINKVL